LSATILLDDELAHSNIIADPSMSQKQQVFLPAASMDSLKRRHAFLSEYSDDVLATTPIETLIKLETTSIKLKNMEKAKDTEDKLSANRDRLAEMEYRIESGVDNRWSKLHDSRFLPGAACSAKKLWSRGREVIGLNKHEAVSIYDMHSIGLAGHVTSKGWIELHDPGSTNMQLRLFSINNCGKRVTAKFSLNGEEELTDICEMGELKTAVRVLREGLSFTQPWNKSVSALEGFLIQTNYCSSDLDGVDKAATLLTQFIDYVLRENGNRWRGQEDFLTTGDLKAAWEAFFGARPQSALVKTKKSIMNQSQFNTNNFNNRRSGQSSNSSFNQQNQTNKGVGGLNVVPAMYMEDICVNFNMGRCLKAPGTCATKKGRQLRHICNFRPDANNPAIYCGANHAACHFH